MLEAVAARREAANDLVGSMSVVRRWLAQDPLHEPAHQALMRLLARSGDRAAATSQYRECVRILSRELGVPPLKETTELYDAISSGSFTTTPVHEPEPEVASVAPPGVAPAPLVGRDQDLDDLVGLHASIGSSSGAGRVAVVEGEAGIGKTRLVEELAGRLSAVGAVVLRGGAYEDEANLPYRPVIDLLRDRVRAGTEWLAGLDDTTLAEAARLVPEVATALPAGRHLPPPAAADEPGAETRFLTAVWETLAAAVAGPAAGVVVLDDAQWADEATLRLVSFGLRRLARHPLLLVLVWRTPLELAVHHAAVTAARDGGAVLALRRLDEASVAELVGAVRPEDAGPESVHRYWSVTEGVPLILVEYLRAEPGEALPAGVREALRARLETVGEAARQVLSAAAVLGRSFDVDTLRTVSGRTDEETVTSLEELLRRGLVREGTNDYDFDHALLRTAVYDETSLARRRLLHGRAADSGRLVPAAQARHLQLAGRGTEAAAAFRTAGRQARAVFANSEALAHYTAALELGETRDLDLLTALADVQVALGEYSGALASLEEAATVATPTERSGVEHRLGRLHARRGEHALAEAHFVAALDTLDEDPRARADVVADRALAALFQGELDRARDLAAEAARIAAAAEDRHASCRAEHLLGMIATQDGDLDRALEHLQRSLDLARSLDDADLEVAALNNLALAHRAGERLDEALDDTRAALELCTRLGDRHREAALHNNLADLLHAQGLDEEAMDHLKRAVEIFAEVGDRGELQPSIWQLVRW